MPYRAHLPLVSQSERYWLRRAYEVATTSPDPSTQNGAVLISDRHHTLIGQGCNRFPAGIAELPERWERPLKYELVVHAEVAAILDAAYHGKATRGATLYCPWACCHACAIPVIAAGITRIVCHAPDGVDLNGFPLGGTSADRWAESIAKADALLKEAGVVKKIVRGTLFEDRSVSVRRDGVLIYP